MDGAMLLHVLSEGLLELGRAEERSVDSGKPRMEVGGTTFTAEHGAALVSALNALAAHEYFAQRLQHEFSLACKARGIEP